MVEAERDLDGFHWGSEWREADYVTEKDGDSSEALRLYHCTESQLIGHLPVHNSNNSRVLQVLQLLKRSQNATLHINPLKSRGVNRLHFAIQV